MQYQITVKELRCNSSTYPIRGNGYCLNLNYKRKKVLSSQTVYIHTQIVNTVCVRALAYAAEDTQHTIHSVEKSKTHQLISMLLLIRMKSQSFRQFLRLYNLIPFLDSYICFTFSIVLYMTASGCSLLTNQTVKGYDL